MTGSGRSGVCATRARRSFEGWPPGPSALTLRAEVARPLHHPDRLDRRATPSAGQTLAAVDLQLVLVLARLPPQIEVRLVVERRPARLDRVLQDLLDRAIEPTDLLGRQRIAHPVVADPG